MRVWFQAKGKRSSTLSREQFDSLDYVDCSGAVDHLRFRAAAPEPVYIVLYIESADVFVAEDIRDVVERQWSAGTAWDWPIPTGTPIYAIRGGTVTSITTYPHNCYGQTNCVACGLGVIITDNQNVQWTYCHGSAHRVNQGDTVAAGQQILNSGNTGNSSGPHLHLGIRTGGVARCPQPLIESLYSNGVGLDPETLPTTGCSY